MSKFKVDDKVVKNFDRWKPNAFDDWGRGLGVGIVVTPPFILDDSCVDVRWPRGRCFEDVEGLVRAPSEFELDVLEWLVMDAENCSTLIDSLRTVLGRSIEEAEVNEALLSLARAGFAQAFVYEHERGKYQALGAIPAAPDPALWFRASDAGKNCILDAAD